MLNQKCFIGNSNLCLFLHLFIHLLLIKGAGKTLRWVCVCHSNSTILIDDSNDFLWNVQILVNGTKVVIGLSVAALVCSDAHNNILEWRIQLKCIVIDGLLGGRHVLPCTEHYILLFDVFDHGGIGLNSFFLQIYNKAMAELRVDHIANEEEIEEHSL